MLAAANGRIATLGDLLKAGVDVNRQDRDGNSALTLAAANGDPPGVARLLLGSDVDVHQRLPDNGRTALHLAAAAGHDDVVAMLLLGKADAQARDAEGQTPLQLALAADHELTAEYLRMPATWEGVKGLHLSRQESDRFLAAAEQGDLAEVERFLNTGAQLLFAYSNEEGLTALMLAARAGHRDVVLRLLLAGANPDIRFNTWADEPALFYTISEGHNDISAMLLLADASPVASANTTPAISALLWAADFGREDVVHLLLGLRAPREIDVNTRDYSGWTALFYGVRREYVNIVRTLLSAGVDPNIRPYPYKVHFWSAESVLDAARQTGNHRIIDLLLEAGAEA